MKSHKIFKEKNPDRAELRYIAHVSKKRWCDEKQPEKITDMFFVDDSKSRRLARCDKIQFNTAGKRERRTHIFPHSDGSQSMWNKLITVRFRWKDCGAFLRAVRIYTHTCPLCSCLVAIALLLLQTLWSRRHRMIIKPIEYRIRSLDSHPPRPVQTC